MDRDLRRSLPARLAALSFIWLILLGNVRLALTLTGQAIPGWISAGMQLGVLGALLGAVGLFLLWFVRRGDGSIDESEESEAEGSEDGPPSGAGDSAP